MRRLILISCLLLYSFMLMAQDKRLWALGASGDVIEYDLATFAEKQRVKVPAEVASSPQNLLVNHLGQMLFSAPVALPLSEGDLAGSKKVWFWDGHGSTTLAREVTRSASTAGSNLAITEAAPVPYLSADGANLYWFSNQARRLQRDGVDLSTKTTWLGWTTDLTGANRKEIASTTLPECSCPTGGCEETCPYGEVWVPDGGVGKLFLMTQFVAGKTQPVYKGSTAYVESSGKWTASSLDPPLRRVLDAPNGDVILEAVPDTGCCGWSNESNDQTFLRIHGKVWNEFDERNAFKNPDYDVSFYTETGKMSPSLNAVALTIVSTTQANKPVQLAEQGQANPEESRQIRKALLDLPAVEVKGAGEAGRRVAFVPHAALVGWINEKEILIIEDHFLVPYNVESGARRKSSIRVEDAGHVFLR